MQEMNTQEVDAVSGGIDFSDAAGFALTALGVAAAGAASPFLAAFAVTVGVGLLVGNAIY